VDINELQLKQAAKAALFSLLNLTFLPGIGFVLLLFLVRKTESHSIAHYYAVIGIKTNIFAGLTLILVNALIITWSGFDSPWTWVFVISYFVFVHALFILFATWTMVRSWTGKKLTASFLSK